MRILRISVIEMLSAQADLVIANCRFGKAKTHLRFQTRGKIQMENCECSLKILLPGDKNYWYEGSPVNDLTIQNCRFVGDSAYILAKPEFEATEAAPCYHTGIRIIGNTFDAVKALDLSCCSNVLFEGNVNSSGQSFENRFRNCADVVENT